MDEVVEFLQHGGLGQAVERVDTHGAHVFLGRDRAWKMKRPVKFRFFDFSTLERREHAIRQELSLNRRTAPSIYLGVVPVRRRSDDRLQIGGKGTPVEWLLEMAKFNPADQLDRMADDGRLDVLVIEKLAGQMARFHEQAEIVRHAGGSSGLADVAAGNKADLLDLCPNVLDAAAVEDLDRRSRALLERHRNLLDRRRQQGRVRHCHGDLHLGNVVMLDGHATPFDCLEFDKQLASVDVIYDLAFLIMDLLARKLPEHAQRALQGWIEVSEDDEAVALLPLCLATRAAVRAKVEGLQDNRQAARDYLELARSVLAEVEPVLVALGGVSGTGKTSLARGLAPELKPVPGAVILRSDVIRKRLFQQEPEEKLTEAAYRPEVSKKVFSIVAKRAKILLDSGQSVIADAVYGEAWQRQAIEDCAPPVPFHGLWLEGPANVLEKRISGRTGDASDADTQILHRQLENINFAKIAWPPVDTSQDAATTLRLAREIVTPDG